ncbi:MAG: hypothetical protein ABSH16_12100 [Sedimentisphaerales bacterium]
MKVLFSVTLLTTCLLFITANSNPLFAADPNQENESVPPPQATQPPPAMEGRQTEWFELMLQRVRDIDPQKAEELAQLKDKDPNAFQTEIHKFMRERMMDQMGQMMEQKGNTGRKPQGRQESPARQGPMMPEGPGFEGRGPEMFRQHMQQWREDFVKWLKENYPDEATKIGKLKKESPEYNKTMELLAQKYAGIFETSKTNPQLATVLKEQLKLREQRADLVRQIKATTDEKQKKQLTADLEKVVGQQFDLIVKHKQLVCEDLAKKLTDLSKELDKKKADIEKWKNADFKNQKVKDRVNELLTETEKFEWE